MNVQEITERARAQMKTPLIFGRYPFPDGRVAKLGTFYLDLCRHAHLVGGSGVGKSTMMVNLIHQTVANGIGVLVIDPHRDLVNDTLARMPARREKDVCLIQAEPEPPPYGNPPEDRAARQAWQIARICANRSPGLNVLECPNPAHAPLVVSNAMGVFQKVMGASWETAVRMRRILKMGITALLTWKGDAMMDDFYQFLINDAFRQQVVTADTGRGRNRYAQQFWLQEFETWGKSEKAGATGPVITRVQEFISNPIAARIINQRQTTVDFVDLMNNSKVILAPVAQALGADIMRFIGTLLVIKMRAAGITRERLPEDGRPPFMTFIDECHNFIMPDLVQALSEDRKRGLGYFFAHQFAAQMKEGSGGGASMLDGLIGNVGTRIIFRVGQDDAPYFARGMEGVEYDDILALENFWAYASFLVKGGNQPVCSLNTMPKPSVSQEMEPTDEPAPEPVAAISKDDLDLVNRVEALPGEEAQIRFLLENVQSEDAWTRFKAARKYRDGKLRQSILRNPQLVPDKVKRITYISALKYGTPGYEVETEVERTAVSLAAASEAVAAGGSNEWQW